MRLKVLISFMCLFQVRLAMAEVLPLSSNKSYQAVIQQFIKSNQALVEARNYQMKVSIDIDSPHNLGGASLEDQQFIISFGDLLPQQDKMSLSAFSFALCHELGHLLGEGPKKINSDGSLRWASAEAQADYYAAQTCLPRLWKNRNDLKHEVVQAGYEMISMVYELIRFSKITKPSLNLRDLSVPEQTILGYPSLQCRLDNIQNAAAGLGAAACWFHPSTTSNP